jgi:hypothetical protein
MPDRFTPESSRSARHTGTVQSHFSILFDLEHWKTGLPCRPRRHFNTGGTAASAGCTQRTEFTYGGKHHLDHGDHRALQSKFIDCVFRTHDDSRHLGGVQPHQSRTRSLGICQIELEKPDIYIHMCVCVCIRLCQRCICNSCLEDGT